MTFQRQARRTHLLLLGSLLFFFLLFAFVLFGHLFFVLFGTDGFGSGCPSASLDFGATADTLEVPVAAVGTGTGASLLMLPLLLSPWWCSCTVARPLHLCCQKSWILVWRQLLWLFGSLCVKT